MDYSKYEEGPAFLIGALAWLKDNFRTALVQTSDGREFIDSETYNEIKKERYVTIALHDEGGHALRLGTCESLVDFLNAPEVRENWPARYRVIIEKSRVSAFLDLVTETETPAELPGNIDFIFVPFISQPASLAFTYDKFKDFLDIHAGKIDAEDIIREFMRNPSVIKRESVEIKDKGAFTEISFQASKGIEGATLNLPKIITVELPTGTREFTTHQKFLFRIRVENFSFELIRIDNDGAWEELLDQVVEFLKLNLPNDLILEGV